MLLTGCFGRTSTSGKIVYLGVKESWLDGLFGYSSDIHVINTDGSGDTNSVVPRGLGFEPKWSPDGQWIVFSTKEVNRPNVQAVLYIMRSDGSQKVQVTNDGCIDPAQRGGVSMSCDSSATAPSWSSDGSHIAFQSANWNIYVMDVGCVLRGEKCTLIPKLVTKGQSPSWSLDGKRLVYESYDKTETYRIYVTNVDGSGTPIDLTPDELSCQEPEWSPTGDKVAVTCYHPQVQGCNWNIYVLNVDGSNATRLTNDGENVLNISPSWSPDGNELAFISNREGLNKCTGNQCCSDIRNKDSIFLMNASGDNIIRLSKQDDEIVRWGWYAWIP